MKPENKSLQIGAAVVAGALLLRIFSGSLPDKITDFLTDPDTMAVMMFMETGQLVRVPQVSVTEPEILPEETLPVALPSDTVYFDADDASLIQINNACGYSVDTAALLQKPLSWELTGDLPSVLILHTHTSESYTGSSDNETTYRTLEENENMLAIGDRLKTLLEKAGIGVLHDRTIHDYPSYNGSYNHARSSIKKYQSEYPSIALILDIHRDAMEDGQGNQIATTLTVNGQESAQLMAVVGTNAGGLNHPDWEENMALAVKLHAQLETMYPGICRPISFRSQRFNQDLSPGSMLIEVGTAGNTKDQALHAVEILAESIIALANGANQ